MYNSSIWKALVGIGNLCLQRSHLKQFPPTTTFSQHRSGQQFIIYHQAPSQCHNIWEWKRFLPQQKVPSRRPASHFDRHIPSSSRDQDESSRQKFQLRVLNKCRLTRSFSNKSRTAQRTVATLYTNWPKIQILLMILRCLQQEAASFWYKLQAAGRIFKSFWKMLLKLLLEALEVSVRCFGSFC